MYAIFGDPHIHNFKTFARMIAGRNSRLLDCVRSVEFIKNYAAQHNYDTLCAGDIFHTFSFVENDSLNLATQLFKDWPGVFLYVTGNHDVKTKDTYESADVGASVITRMNSKAFQLEGQVYIDDRKGVRIFGMGWKSPRDFYKQTFLPADIFMGHQMVNTVEFPTGLDTDKIEDMYKLMIFGDIHRPLHKGKLLIPGAPLQHSFKDEGQARGFWRLNDEFRLEFIPITFTPKFITVSDVARIKVGDGNFYRLQTPTKETNLGDNVIAQRQVKHDFREAGLSAEMPDDNLIRGYLALSDLKDAAEDMQKEAITRGVEILGQCKTDIKIPRKTQVTKVTLENFASFIGRHEFDIQKDLYLFLGANGNGKTSIFEAIYWGLFGDVTKEGALADEVVNDKIGKNCMVQVDMLCDGQELRILRYRKHDEFDNEFWYTNAGGKVKRDSTAETQEELESLLGTNKLFYKNMNYFSQENFEFFSSMTDASQKKVCKSFLPLDRYEAAVAIADKKLREVVDKSDEIKRQMDSLIIRMGEKSEMLKRYKVGRVQFEEDRKRRMDGLELQVGQAQVKCSNLALSYKAEAEVLIQMRQGVPILDFTDLDELLAEVKGKLDAERTALGNEQLSITQAVRAGAEQLSKTDDLYKKLLSQKVTLEANIVQNQRNEIVYAKNLEEAEKGVCNTCGQKLPASKIAAMRDTIAFSLDIARRAIASDKEALANRSQEVAKTQADWKDQGTKLDALKQSLQDNLSKVAKLRTDFEAEKSWTQQKKEARSREALKDIEARIREKELALQNDKNVMDSAMIEYKRVMGELDEWTVKEYEYEKDIRRLEGELKENEAKQYELAGSLDVYAVDIRIYDFWVKGFGNQGIVSFLLDDFAKLFTQLANETLLNVSKGKFYAVLSTQKKLKSGEYREKFEFIIYIDGAPRSYAVLSGGQKARINLATAIALNKLVKKYFGLDFYPFGILILDELFTYLDEEGVESVYFELESLIKDCAVYCVTNKSDVKSFFANVVNVEFTKEEGSRIALSGAKN